MECSPEAKTLKVSTTLGTPVHALGEVGGGRVGEG
jgi:hypothetical protein